MFFTSSDNHYLTSFINTRKGEQRLGEVLTKFSSSENFASNLNSLKAKGVKFVLLGIPEDIGPRANHGKPGADQGWEAFLSKFCSLQQNEFIKGDEVAILGHVNCDDLQDKSSNLDGKKPADLTILRQMVETLDHRVYSICKQIFVNDLTPIIIGGGHNNAYPILKAASESFNQPLGAINLDPHTDFRITEGRHSGNGFSYAATEGYLKAYYSLGMHELKNSEASLDLLKANQFECSSYQDIWVRRRLSFEQALLNGLNYLNKKGLPFGVELDVDCISMVPASAYTNCGIQVQDSEFYTYSCAYDKKSCYLHLAEGAPIQHPSGYSAGMNDVGQVYSTIVTAFIQGKQDAFKF